MYITNYKVGSEHPLFVTLLRNGSDILKLVEGLRDIYIKYFVSKILK